MPESDQQGHEFRVLTEQLGVLDAKPLFDAFKDAGVRFEFHVDDNAIRTMSPSTARLGGTFGRGVHVSISVHENDWALAQRIWSQFCES